MLATVMYGPRDIRCEQVDDPNMLKPTDAIIKLSATCICRSDLPRDGRAARDQDDAHGVSRGLIACR
jgi:threonine dehydrogenase-like Zn-dependent dehydrogenase